MSGIGSGVRLAKIVLFVHLSDKHVESVCCVQYDYSVSTFSPDGKVFQTEYAQKSVDNSPYALLLSPVGVVCSTASLGQTGFHIAGPRSA